MKHLSLTRIVQTCLALAISIALSACGGSSKSPATVTQDTSNAVIEIPAQSEECQSSLAIELLNSDPHGEDPVLDTHRELLIKCSAERSAIHAYEQSLLPASQLARRTTEIAPIEGLINFESPHVHPIDITPNGAVLVSVNTAAHTLEVWSISGSSISSIASIPVGLDPVSVRARNDNEVWVVNHMSDSISIVDLDRKTVIQTLKTQNEPSDIIFAGANRAFVSVSEANSINVFNLNNLNADPAIVRIAGEEPRSLAVSADGSTVYAGIYESGNGTTFSGSRGSGLPIVRDDSIMDNDVAIIDSGSLQVTYRRRLLNMVMAIGVNPSTQEVHAVGTEALNTIAGEPALKGRFIKVNSAKFSGPGLANATITDLNPHLDYTTATVSNSLRQQSLGDPRSIVWQRNGQRAFIAGMGSNNIAVINSAGNRIAHFDVGQGPTGIALKEAAGIGFVMNKFAGSISVISLNSLSQISEVKFDDPTPLAIREGRPFIYDTHLTSGTGHTSCASCHVDSRTDRLGWQLSDEQNTSITIPSGPNIVPGNATGTGTFSSNKGIMVTQTLLDIMEHPRFHWRGDKESIDDFNGTYVNLMGRESVITQTQMDKMKAFLRTLWLPPNPYRRIDNSRPTTITLPDGTTGTSELINSTTSALRGGAGRDCLGCHSGQGNGSRSDNGIHQDTFGLPGLHIVAPAFPGYYDKIGFAMGLSGFGFFHDGTSNFKEAARPPLTRHITEILTLEGPEGPLVGDEVRQAPHAGVGQQVTINNNPSAAQSSRLDQLISIANNSSWAELIAHSRVGDSQRGYVLQQNESFTADAQGQTATKASLLNQAASGSSITFTLVAKGMSTRLALDSDLDGILNLGEDDGQITPLQANPDTEAATSANTININPLLNDTGDNLVLQAPNVWSWKGGKVALSGNQLRYTPKPGFNGQDKIWYIIKDSRDRSTSSVININVSGNNNVDIAPPVAKPDTFSVNSSNTLTINPLFNDTGTELTLIAPNVWSLRGGNVALASNRLNYKPKPGFNGQDKIWYTIRDTQGRTSFSEITLNVSGNGVVNAAPVANPDTVAVTSPNTLSINPLANDTGTGLILVAPNVWSLKGGNVALVSNRLSYKPKSGFNGQDKIWYTIRDTQGRTSFSEITLNVSSNETNNNVPPFPVANADTYTVPRNATRTLNILNNDIPSGLVIDTLYEYSAKGGRTVKLNSRDVSYTPKVGFTGVDDFWYVVVDSQGRKNSAKVTINVSP